ncbi:hypothetical protein Pelo_4340 [Pelomyxa schiedti]|nr:hypothetical protein Pelo_4340 [Pelomyxa schiedti]
MAIVGGTGARRRPGVPRGVPLKPPNKPGHYGTRVTGHVTESPDVSFDVWPLHQQDVVRLDVTVEPPSRVEVTNCTQHAFC